MRRITLGCLLIAIGAAWTGSADNQPSHPKPKVPLKIIGPDSNFPGQVWGQMYFSPLLSFRVLKGKVPDVVALCDVVEDHRTVAEKHYNVITLHCEEGLVMELEGIDLQGGRQ